MKPTGSWAGGPFMCRAWGTESKQGLFGELIWNPSQTEQSMRKVSDPHQNLGPWAILDIELNPSDLRLIYLLEK